MLLYCEKCQIVFESTECPICGSSTLREVHLNDPCFLCEKPIMWAEMLKSALQDNGIPVIFQKKLGAGLALKIGYLNECAKVYVPFSCLKEATDIRNTFFGDTEEVLANED